MRMDRSVRVSLAFFCLASVLFLTQAHKKDVNSVLLTEDNFSAELDNQNYFVMFFAPWCGHCQQLASLWAQLANAWKNDSSVKIGRVDCSTDNAVCHKQGVSGYPMLKFYREDSSSVVYGGERSLEAFNYFIAEQISGEEDQYSISFGDDS